MTPCDCPYKTQTRSEDQYSILHQCWILRWWVGYFVDSSHYVHLRPSPWRQKITTPIYGLKKWKEPKALWKVRASISTPITYFVGTIFHFQVRLPFYCRIWRKKGWMLLRGWICFWGEAPFIYYIDQIYGIRNVCSFFSLFRWHDPGSRWIWTRLER